MKTSFINAFNISYCIRSYRLTHHIKYQHFRFNIHCVLRLHIRLNALILFPCKTHIFITWESHRNLKFEIISWQQAKLWLLTEIVTIGVAISLGLNDKPVCYMKRNQSRLLKFVWTAYDMDEMSKWYWLIDLLIRLFLRFCHGTFSRIAMLQIINTSAPLHPAVKRDIQFIEFKKLYLS